MTGKPPKPPPKPPKPPPTGKHGWHNPEPGKDRCHRNRTRTRHARHRVMHKRRFNGRHIRKRDIRNVWHVRQMISGVFFFHLSGFRRLWHIRVIRVFHVDHFLLLWNVIVMLFFFRLDKMCHRFLRLRRRPRLKQLIGRVILVHISFRQRHFHAFQGLAAHKESTALVLPVWCLQCPQLISVFLWHMDAHAYAQTFRSRP